VLSEEDTSETAQRKNAPFGNLHTRTRRNPVFALKRAHACDRFRTIIRERVINNGRENDLLKRVTQLRFTRSKCETVRYIPAHAAVVVPRITKTAFSLYWGKQPRLIVAMIRI